MGGLRHKQTQTSPNQSFSSTIVWTVDPPAPPLLGVPSAPGADCRLWGCRDGGGGAEEEHVEVLDWYSRVDRPVQHSEMIIYLPKVPRRAPTFTGLPHLSEDQFVSLMSPQCL